MDNNKIKAVIFDLGNVVVDFNHLTAAERFSRFCDYSQKEIYDMFFDSSLTRLFEKGQIRPKEFYLRVKNKLKAEISYSEFLPIWNDIFFLTDNNLKIHQMIKKLKEKYKIFLLSNLNKLHFLHLKSMLNGVFERFDELILSYEVNSVKPEKKIYDIVKNLANTEFENIVYTDDRQDLINAAVKLGIKSIQYKNPQELKKRLAGLGIKA